MTTRLVIIGGGRMGEALLGGLLGAASGCECQDEESDTRGEDDVRTGPEILVDREGTSPQEAGAHHHHAGDKATPTWRSVAHVWHGQIL